MTEQGASGASDIGLTSGFSDTGDEAADAVSNRDGGKYDEGDAATETGTSEKEAEGTYHAARDDYQEDEGLGDRHDGGWD